MTTLWQRSSALLWPLAGILALGIAVRSRDVRTLLIGAVAHVRPAAVLATLPGQAAACLLCGAALFVLCPGVSFRASIGARLLRDAGANLLLFMPGLGDVIGARALVLAGGGTRTAVTASAMDTLAETLAQVPFAALAVLVLPGVPFHAGSLWASAAEVLPWIAAVAVMSAVLLPFASYAFTGFPDAFGRLAMLVTRELALLYAEMRARRHAVPAAVALHVGAWAMGGVQLWMIAQTLSLHLDLFPAVVVESTAYAARAVIFFVPAGLGVQEAALVFAGLSYGLDPVQSLAIALVFRVRDLAFGLPLLLWPVFELRRS